MEPIKLVLMNLISLSKLEDEVVIHYKKIIEEDVSVFKTKDLPILRVILELGLNLIVIYFGRRHLKNFGR